jgi:hypothetical protein
MRLSDVVSHSGLAGYAVVALVLFMIAFLAVVIGVLLRSRREIDHVARLPFDDEPRRDQEGGGS